VSPDENVDRPPIPWHEAPDDATHALWSSAQDHWYFWKVDKEGVTQYWIRDWIRAYGWSRHAQQTASRSKLQEYLKAGDAFQRPGNEHPQTDTDKGYTPMNLNNAALLVRDDITTVKVQFPDKYKGNTVTYILHNSISANPGDHVLAQHGDHLEVGTITKKDAEPQINVNSDVRYDWVICNVTTMQAPIDREIEKTHAIARALKQRQAANVRDQILQQFGVTSATELMALDSDNAQSE
jgi:hypothetical protein